MEIVRVERGRTDVEEVIKSKEVISSGSSCFKAMETTTKQVRLVGLRGSIFLRGREPGFVFNKAVKEKFQRRD